MDDIETLNDDQSQTPAKKAAHKQAMPKTEPGKCKACDGTAELGSMFCKDHQAKLVQKRKKQWFARFDVLLAFGLIAVVIGYPRMKGKVTGMMADYLESEGSNEPGFFAKASDFLASMIPEEDKTPDKDTKRVAAALRKSLLGGGGPPSPQVEEMIRKVENSGEPLSLDQAIDQLQAMSGAEHMGLSNTQLAQLQSMRGSGGGGAPAISAGAAAVAQPAAIGIAPAPFCLPPPDQRNSPALAALSKCGNGIIEVGEECDGPALSGATCKSLGFSGDCGDDATCVRPGLACLRSCSFDYSGCTNESEAAVQRFVMHDDGTATDRLTGLMWEQKCTDVTCSDQHNVFSAVSWRNGATQWINALNAERFGGHDDWRLPSLEEMRTLLTVVPPCPTEPCPGAVWPREQTATAGYWTSTTFAVDKGRAWAVSFADGDVYTAEKDATLHVRAVRRGS
jgi:hypothetical protein